MYSAAVTLVWLNISHVLAVPSSDAVTINLPSGLKAAELIQAVWPARVWSSSPVAVSHIFAVPSSDAVTINLPSGLKAADLTLLLWSSRVWIHWPVFTSHIWLALRPSEKTINVPSWLKFVEARSNLPQPVSVASFFAVICDMSIIGKTSASCPISWATVWIVCSNLGLLMKVCRLVPHALARGRARCPKSFLGSTKKLAVCRS